MDHRQQRRFILRAGASLFVGAMVGRAWAGQTIRIALGLPAYLPLYDPARRDGAGVFVDVFREVFGHRMGIEPVFTLFPWARAQSLVEVGKQDAFCTVITADRLAYAVASRETVVTLPNRLFVRADNALLAQLRNVTDVASLRAVNPRILGYIGNEWAQRTFAGMRLDNSNDFDNAVRKLVAGHGDVLIDDAYSVRGALAKIPGGSQVLMLEHDFVQTSYHLMIGKQSPHASIMPAFDVQLATFKAEPGYRKILLRYGVLS